MYTPKQRFKIHEYEQQIKKLFRLCFKEIVNNPKYINKLQKRIERFEKNLIRDGKTVLNPMFDPLQLFYNTCSLIEERSLIIKRSYINTLRQNNIIPSIILLRSDLELGFLYFFYINKTFEYLKRDNWGDFYKLSLKIYMGKQKNDDIENQLNDSFQEFFGEETLKLNTKIHIGDLIKYSKKANINNFLESLEQVSMIDYLLKLDTSFYIYGMQNITPLFDNWNAQDTIYDSLCEIVHPTAMNFITLSQYKIFSKNPDVVELGQFSQINKENLIKIEDLASALGYAFRLHFFKFMSCSIYYHYHKSYLERHLEINKKIGLKIYYPTIKNKPIIIENIKTKKQYTVKYMEKK